jgi:beta-1,4-mannosyltransferase
MLWRAPSPDYVLLQTPPCVPSFAVCALVAFLRRAVFVVDWHNTAHSLMALEFGTTHPLVQIARWYERVAGSTLPRAHLCVSDAFRVHLESEFGIRGAVVLYDRAPAFFKRTSVEDAHALFVRRVLLHTGPHTTAFAW